jgi:hypothetical protein
MRFQTDEGLAQLEEHANSRADDSSDKGNTLEHVD